jgi:hypothetical protein
MAFSGSCEWPTRQREGVFIQRTISLAQKALADNGARVLRASGMV